MQNVATTGGAPLLPAKKKSLLAPAMGLVEGERRVPIGSHGSLLPPYSVYPRSRSKTRSGGARLSAEGNQLWGF